MSISAELEVVKERLRQAFMASDGVHYVDKEIVGRVFRELNLKHLEVKYLSDLNVLVQSRTRYNTVRYEVELIVSSTSPQYRLVCRVYH